MGGTRRTFLQTSMAGATLDALPRSLMAEALDSIKKAFAKVSANSPEETAKDES